MTQINIHPHAPHHLSHTSEVGLYSVLGMLAVTALVMLGIYWLAQSALAGVASMLSGI